MSNISSSLKVLFLYKYTVYTAFPYVSIPSLSGFLTNRPLRVLLVELVSVLISLRSKCAG
jgi:hypothetical protein